jgi:hypothetical protein
MASVLARIGRTHITVHGFRHTFSALAAERTGYANHVVEMALAHVVGNKVEAAYCRGDLLDRRRRLMADWVRYCGANPTELSGKVTANSTGAMKMVPRRRLSEWLLRPGRGMRPWIDALLKVDRNNDVAPLVSLLRSSSTPLPQDGRRHMRICWNVTGWFEKEGATNTIVRSLINRGEADLGPGCHTQREEIGTDARREH